MIEQGDLFPPKAHARRGDPITSHEAADSLDPDTIRESQQEVLRLFRKYKALTDHQLLFVAEEARIAQSPSGLRTRRRELCDLGLLRDTGDKTLLPSGRRAIIWGLV